jgi:hypothetical protein
MSEEKRDVYAAPIEALREDMTRIAREIMLQHHAGEEQVRLRQVIADHENAIATLESHRFPPPQPLPVSSCTREAFIDGRSPYPCECNACVRCSTGVYAMQCNQDPRAAARQELGGGDARISRNQW